MIARVPWLLVVISACAIGPRGTAAAEPVTDAPDAAVFAEKIQPFLASYCVRCHGAEEANAEMRLDVYPDAEAALADRPTWEKVLDRLSRQEMPPEDEEPRPSDDEVVAVVGWIEAELSRLDRQAPLDPGRVTARRLNRVEYVNTIRDLLGVEFEAADDFPADDVGYGFDNIGDVLSLPPLLMEKYLAAAESIAAEVIRLEGETTEIQQRAFAAPAEGEEHTDVARANLAPFARRAYRRPLSDDEIDRLVALATAVEDSGDSFERSMQVALTAVLVSPHFLFRIEHDPDPHDPAATHTISDHELASRLSYFLWSSMPDEELFAAADAGTIRGPDVLDAQVRRMLADPKSQALVENFAGQWLQWRSLSNMTPDPEQFPGFDEELREAMRRETELFFADILREDRSVLLLLDADYTFLNERLATHYGIEGVEGHEFRRVELDDRRRGGVIAHGSVLTVTSNPTRTSPVKRGKWILENLLGDPPPPPPPGVEDLKEDEEAVLSGSLRQRMEQHRAKASCASCHARMDPLGFGLENYDAVGAWRTEDAGFAIDASGTLPDGQSFDGPGGLKEILTAHRLDFCRCLAEKMLTYALGRGLETYDRPAVGEIVARLDAGDDCFSSLILAIVHSPPFQMRRGEGGSS